MDFETKEYDLRFIIDGERQLNIGVNVCLNDIPPIDKDDFYWIDSINYDEFGFIYKLFGVNDKFHVGELKSLLPVLVSDEPLDYYDLFYHNGKIHEVCALYHDESDDNWKVMDEFNDIFNEKDVLKVVATPDKFGWVYNEGPPHDHNYDWVDSRYLEVYRESILINCVNNDLKIKVLVEAICEDRRSKLDDCLSGMRLVPKLHNNKIIIDYYNLIG